MFHLPDGPTSVLLAAIMGYGFAILLGGLLTRLVVRAMWRLLEIEAALESPNSAIMGGTRIVRYPWLTDAVGFVERALYLSSILIGKPEFLALWLTLKTVARSLRWTADTSVPGRAIYNTFLVGNGLSVLFAAAGAGTVYWLAGASWQRDPFLAWVVPVALALATVALLAYLKIVLEMRKTQFRDRVGDADYQRWRMLTRPEAN